MYILTNAFCCLSLALPLSLQLISRISLELRLPPLAAPEITIPAVGAGSATVVDAADKGAHYVNAIGYAIFDDVSVEIGGSTIDQLFSDYGEFLPARMFSVVYQKHSRMVSLMHCISFFDSESENQDSVSRSRAG